VRHKLDKPARLISQRLIEMEIYLFINIINVALYRLPDKLTG
jgi:hypothetical protein